MKFISLIGESRIKIDLKEDTREGVLVEGRRYRVDLKKLGNKVISLLLDGKSYELLVEEREGKYRINLDGITYEVTVEDERELLLESLRKTTQEEKILEISAPMPGLVMAVEVKPGQKVNAQQGLMILEAMKMENEIRSPREAVVKEIRVKKGEPVERNQVLLLLVSGLDK